MAALTLYVLMRPLQLETSFEMVKLRFVCAAYHSREKTHKNQACAKSEAFYLCHCTSPKESLE